MSGNNSNQVTIPPLYTIVFNIWESGELYTGTVRFYLPTLEHFFLTLEPFLPPLPIFIYIDGLLMNDIDFDMMEHLNKDYEIHVGVERVVIYIE